MNRPTLFVLIVLNALFIVVLGAEFLTSTETTSIISPLKTDNVESEESALEFDLTAMSEDSYSDLVDRPMFIKGRKPVDEPESESAPTTEMKKVEAFFWDLTGIFTTPKGATAFFSRTNAKVLKDNYRKSKIGEELDGWKMIEIHTDNVVLTQMNETKTLMLRKEKPKTASVPIQSAQTQKNINNRIPQSPPAIQQKIEREPPPETTTQNSDDLSVETINPENL